MLSLRTVINRLRRRTHITLRGCIIIPIILTAWSHNNTSRHCSDDLFQDICHVSILKSCVCWSNFLRSSSQTCCCKFQNVIFELQRLALLMCRLMQLLEREREIKRAWIPASVRLLAAFSRSVSANSESLSWTASRTLLLKKCHVAFQFAKLFYW